MERGQACGASFCHTPECCWHVHGCVNLNIDKLILHGIQLLCTPFPCQLPTVPTYAQYRDDLASLTNLSFIPFLSHLRKLIRLGVMPRTLKYLKLICSHSDVRFCAQVSTSEIALTTHNAPFIVHNKYASMYNTNTAVPAGKHAARLAQSPVAFHSPFTLRTLPVMYDA